MGTAFAAFGNSTIIFKTATGESTIDEYGNKLFNLADYPVECFVREKKLPASEELIHGNINGIYVEGRCISPRTLPEDVLPETIYSAVVDGKKYDFRYIPSVQSPWYKEHRILGQRVRGFLITSTIWQEG